jgi:hypothetical protein
LRLTRAGTPPQEVRGEQLYAWPVDLAPGEEVHLLIEPQPPRQDWRQSGYRASDAAAARAWQQTLRRELTALLRVDDLLAAPLPAQVTLVRQEPRDDVVFRELEFASTSARPLRATWCEPSTPSRSGAQRPAVVCIHGHGGTRGSVHDAKSIYRAFATELARAGFVTIACDVGQHAVQEAGRSLMGERFLDLRRCVDVLCSHAGVDAARIGCAGLSLGGEMAMWLGALDERVAAVASCGFLTTMDQMERGHCPCWNFPGLRQLADWADVYALIAPRPLHCQNGLAEPATDFCVPLARVALRDIQRAYADLGAPDAVRLHVHGEGHVVDVPALVGFFTRVLASPPQGAGR